MWSICDEAFPETNNELRPPGARRCRPARKASQAATVGRWCVRCAPKRSGHHIPIGRPRNIGYIPPACRCGGAASSSSTLVEASRAFVFAIIERIFVDVAVALAITAGAGAAFAAGDFPLSGNYTQNVLCKGDGTDPVAANVPPRQCSSVAPRRSWKNRRHPDGSFLSLRQPCKSQQRAGPIR
jgi:hypothetical protein